MKRRFKIWPTMRPIPGATLNGRLDAVQALRFLAAAMVVVSHAYYYSAIKYAPITGASFIEWFILKLSGIGVDIFFVLSGFVIARQAGIDVVRFVLHRVLRIYPAYFAAIALGGAIMVAFGHWPISLVKWDASLLLIPVGALQGWTGVPYWTLIYEVYFYLVVSILMLTGTRGYDVGLGLWTILVLLASLIGQPLALDATDAAQLVTSPLALYFIAGAALARFLSGRPWPLLVGIALCLIALCWKPIAQRVEIQLAYTAVILVVLWLAVIVSPAFIKWPGARIFVLGGDWSYGLYLIHVAIIYTVCIRIPTTAMPLTILITIASLAGGAGGLIFGWLEYFTYRNYLRRLADSWLALKTAKAEIKVGRCIGAGEPRSAASCLSPETPGDLIVASLARRTQTRT